MQRTKKKLEARERKKRETELKKECFGNGEEAETAQGERPKFEFSTDLTQLEGLKFGRMSFKGCNPEVEKLMVYYERKMSGDVSDSDSDDGVDIGDLEMTETLRGNPSTNPRPGRGRKLNISSTGLNESGTRDKLNFTDVRKRGAQSSWTSPAPRGKSRKSC
ncbi:unnamed protein product [Heligmosomoides polygyrus]|uniref:M-phase phosphoprotein 6 n=1 Tax=Heligmosomoides polygyrus TaxID=6339 RepID=A0A183FXK3_HELPZ|nr:unnamed protein product [Heligmosomoides polygyrus]